MRGRWEAEGSLRGPDVSPSAGVRTASLTRSRERAEMCVSFRHVPSAKLQKPLLGVGDTDRHEHHNCTCLASCLRKTDRKSNSIEKTKIQHGSRHCQHPARAQRLQKHCRQQHHRQPPSHPAPRNPCPWHHQPWVSQQHLVMMWPVQALNPPRACRKWEFLVSGLLLGAQPVVLTLQNL